MSKEWTRATIAILSIIGFFMIVAGVLVGLVDIFSPEIAKLVGMVVGYVTALINAIIVWYFKEEF